MRTHLLAAKVDSQIAQLFWIDFGWRLRHQIEAAIIFGNAITSRMVSSPQISMTSRSSPSAIPPCGGAPSRSARSKWPKSDCRSSAADAERFEHFLLQFRLMNAHAAAADLDAV